MNPIDRAEAPILAVLITAAGLLTAARICLRWVGQQLDAALEWAEAL